MINKLLRSVSDHQTIFTFAEVSQITRRRPDKNLISALSYYVKKGELIRLAKGIYALNENYSKTELANKLRRPSYISLYTVFQQNNIVFQVYTSIFSISGRSEIIKINSQKFIYRKIKNSILLNPDGLTEKKGVFIATPERALLDKIYLDGEEYFDNLESINWEQAEHLNQNIYQSKIIAKFIKKYA